jgi:hypothetical protein
VAGICLALIFVAWFQLDELSHKSSGSSLNVSQLSVTPGSLENLAGGEFLSRTTTSRRTGSNSGLTRDRALDEWEQKLYGKQATGKDIVCYFLETVTHSSAQRELLDLMNFLCCNIL